MFNLGAKAFSSLASTPASEEQLGLLRRLFGILVFVSGSGVAGGGVDEGGIERQRAIHGRAIEFGIVFEGFDLFAAKTGLPDFGREFVQSESAIIGMRMNNPISHLLE